MNDSVWILVAELIVVVLAIFMGTRTSGIGLGVWGLVGVAVLVFVFGEAPGNAPVSTMQAAGGIDWMVSVAAKVIRKRPKSVVFLAPAMSFLFTVGAGTGNIFYPLLPVIYDVSYQQKIRPERALSVSAVASQVGILCSPVSAATASMVVLLAPQGVDLGGLLLIMWPASIAGLLVAALVMMRHGKDLEDDPEYQKRLAEGQIKPPSTRTRTSSRRPPCSPPRCSSPASR